ncbi:phage baseplate assembly protein V [Flavobacterium tructae]|uniref:type VI secretion system Vgr family protein n=1 Tax=Flavobacterium TaxID=237 RepID=UPI002224325C|nr:MULTISPECIES: phage baseplate assembly protein V [Flavobacterium]MDL2145129.1 phage baseplate assembly protein V [Flavobacterium tructae]
MLQQKIIFGVDRKEVSHYTSIEVIQSINNHHKFTIKVPHSVIEQPRAFTMENAQSWLGKVVHIVLERENNFLGIVTNIEYAQELGHVGSQIILTGYSKTILLESGEKLHSWEDSTLQEIIQEIIQDAAGEQLQNDIKPEFTTKIDYQTQYLETDFRYIQRLAKQYNEWLYYDGEKLFFGKPVATNKTIKLTYNKDLYNLNISVKATPNQFAGFTYNENSNTLYRAKTQDKIEGLPKLGNQAFDASEKLYATPSFEYGRIATGDDMFLERILKRRQESVMADANFITATSKNNTLKIGSVITIDSQQVIDKIDAYNKKLDNSKVNYQTSEIGTYIITEITHKATDIGEYENSFKALPAFIKKLPEPQITFPLAQTQQAIVVENADPKNNGRIRVKMLWQQTKNLRTPWLRVMTPDAGSSSEVSTNRGMVFIPEVGDHVMLGFRYNDPDRPFVIGSLFNGKIGAGGQTNNNIKSIYTRTGSTITFDEGASSILVKDPSGNTWFMDGKGNINVNAPKNITMHAGEDFIVHAGKNIRIDAGENMDCDAGKNISQTAGNDLTQTASGDITETSDNRKELVDKDFTRQADISSELASGVTIFSNKENLTLQSGKTVEVNSVEKSKMF